MMNKLITAIALLITLITISAGSVSAATDPFSSACTQPGASSSTVCTTKNENPIYGPTGIIVKVTKIIAYVAGIAAVIIIMIGGMMYITSAGDSKSASSARSTVLFALVGLVIIVAAQTIIVFVIDRIK